MEPLVTEQRSSAFASVALMQGTCYPVRYWQHRLSVC